MDTNNPVLPEDISLIGVANTPSSTPASPAVASVAGPTPIPTPSVPPPQPQPQIKVPSHFEPSPKKKTGPLGLIFGILGLVIIIGLAVVTGLMSKIVPGFGAVTITYWGLWEPESVMRPILDEFEKSHPGIKVVYVYQSREEYRERLQSAIAQKKGPDVFRIHNTWTPMFRNYLDPVPASVYSTADYVETFYPVAATDFRVGNNFVAVPLETDGIAMFVNDDILQKNNQKVPENWDQLKEAAIAMSLCQVENGDCSRGGNILVSGVSMGSTENVDHWQDIIAALMLQNNVDLSNPSAPSPVATDAKPAPDVLQYFANFADTYHIWNKNLPNSTTSFALGKVGIYFGPSWRIFDIQAINPKLRFSVHPIPQLPVDPQRGESPITYASYWAEAVNKDSKYSAQAWELIKYLSSVDILPKLYNQAIGPTRLFGEPYSRTDLAATLSTNNYVGPFITQAPLAKSWYLASFTFDGKNGLNTRLSDLFAEALTRRNSVTDLSKGISAVLSEYGIVAGSPFK